MGYRGAIPAWVPAEFHTSYRSAANMHGEEEAASIARYAKACGRWPARHGRKATVLSHTERAEMVAAWVAGERLALIASRYDVHPVYVRVAANRAGFFKRGSKSKAAPA